MSRFAFALFLTALMIAFLSCSTNDKPANSDARIVNAVNTGTLRTPAPSASVDELASGRRLYMTNCANCHKENGSGGEVEIEGTKLNPDDLTSAKIKAFSDEKTLRYIMNGVPDEGMPAFKGKLSEAEMRDVLRFIRTELQKMPGNAISKS